MYRVYVIQLKRSVWIDSVRFRNRNPGYQENKPIVYVGSTGKEIEERVADHLAGGRTANTYACRYFKRLRPDIYKGIKPRRSRASIERREARLADELRARGWGVWQG